MARKKPSRIPLTRNRLSRRKQRCKKVAALTARPPRLRRADVRDIPLRELAAVPCYPKTRLTDLDDLREAIEATRLILPPEVMAAPAGHHPAFFVLNGWRRVAVAKQLGLASLRCDVWPHGALGTDPVLAFVKIQAGIAEGELWKRRAQEDQDRASMGLPPLTDAEHEALEEEREEAEYLSELAEEEAVRAEQPEADEDAGAGAENE